MISNNYPVDLFIANYGDPVEWFNQCDPREWTFVFREDFHHTVKITMCGYTAFCFVQDMLDEIVSIHVVTDYDMVCTSIVCNPIDDEGAF